jgi:hypothetical protein
MHRQISESDWKKWRLLSEVALERFCEHVLREAAQLAGGDGSAHKRYLDQYKFVRESDKELGRLFDGRSRSNAYSQMAAALASGLITEKDLATFSDETREVVALLAGDEAARRVRPRASPK